MPPIKTPTPWTPSTKSDTGWVPDTKNPTVFTKSGAKNPTTFINADTKNPTTYIANGVAEVPYEYDSSVQLYDDATRAYDYLTFVANQLNQVNPTGWAVTA